MCRLRHCRAEGSLGELRHSEFGTGGAAKGKLRCRRRPRPERRRYFWRQRHGRLALLFPPAHQPAAKGAQDGLIGDIVAELAVEEALPEDPEEKLKSS